MKVKTMKIIDSHAHIYPPELQDNRDAIAATEPWFAANTASKVQKWGTAEELVSTMDEMGIESTLVTSFAFYDQGLCRMVNDYVLDAAKRFKGRILPMAVVSPCRKGAEEEILRCAEKGAVGVGELFPDGQNLDIKNKSETWRLVGSCDECGLFISFHTAEQAGHTYPGKGTTGAEDAVKFCFNHPEARVVFAHFGGGAWAFEAMPEVRLALSNAYYDTAAMPWLYTSHVIDAIFAIGAGNKLLFGTDWPILNRKRYDNLIASTKLTDFEKNLLFRENAKNLLGAKFSFSC